MKKVTCKFYLPHNLDIVQLELDNPPKFNYSRDKALHLLNLVSTIPSNTRSDFDDYNGWTPISSSIIKNQYSIRDFPIYREWFIDVGLIDCDWHYIVNEKSYHYRFTEKFRTKIKPFEYEIKKTLAKKMRASDNTSAYHKQEYPELRCWFNSKLTIDVNSAMDYLDLKHRVEREEDKERALYKYNSAVIGVDKMADHNYHYSVDETAGRLHTNFTSMPSEIRNFTKFDGKQLVSLDFKNSQPLISSVLFKPSFWEVNTIDNEDNYQYESSSTHTIDDFSFKLHSFSYKFLSITDTSSISPSTSSKYTTPLMLAEKRLSIDKEDVNSFISHVENGDLYEYMEQRIKSISNSDKKWTRKELKAIMFKIMFTDNRYTDDDKKLFKSIFPTVYNMFAFIKRKEKRLLPVLLQTIESNLFLNKIVGRIASERPDLPIFTIHDSITTTKGNEEYVKNVMLEVTEIAIGVTPSIDIADWSPSNIKWSYLRKKAGISKKHDNE